jgi:hypothetical protein
VLVHQAVGEVLLQVADLKSLKFMYIK